MKGEERRKRILQVLRSVEKPVSAGAFAKDFHVSRQVIVQDIALIRANGVEILSTNRGYRLADGQENSRIFKVHHTPEETEEELRLIIDLGGRVRDVFVYHKVYGVLRGELNLESRADIENYMAQIRSGKSTLLSNITSGFHYHTVTAKSEEILDRIQDELGRKGFLAKLVEYEPVVFGKKS
ncbi:MAG: transcription repressor NadR [Eubacterium sp.]|nr:transcription repressor NadR [Eubacterium sp.]